jgi:hypothetical protein
VRISLRHVAHLQYICSTRNKQQGECAFSKPSALELPSSQTIRYAEDAAASIRMVTYRSTPVQ